MTLPTFVRWYGPLTLWCQLASVAFGQNVIDTAQQNVDVQLAQGINLIVKVHVHDATGGGGIILGASRDSIYIVTARHVLNAGSPDSIRVWFHFNQADSVAARRFSDSSAIKSLADIALLAVDRRSVPGFETAGLEFNRLAAVHKLGNGDRIFSVGCPFDDCWKIEPGEYVIGVGTEILIASPFVRPGKSGGAFLNEWGEVAGMILEEKGDLPLGSAVNIDLVLGQVRAWLQRDPPLHTTLHPPRYPRGGYALEVGTAFLSSANRNHDRFPSGRIDLSGHLARALDWHVGALRLAPENLALTAATAGLAIPLSIGRATLSLMVDGGMGRAESRHDLGGYSTTTNGATTYEPNWATALGFGFGGGIGGSMKVLIAPRVFIDAMAAKWAFQTPIDSPPIPGVFYGAGLRWAIR